MGVYAYNTVDLDRLIGSYSIGLSTLYRNFNHEFYKTWLTLFNTSSPKEPQGYLQISCFIVGPNERHLAYGQDEENVGEEGGKEMRCSRSINQHVKLINNKKMSAKIN
jgi:hypothetical protein